MAPATGAGPIGGEGMIVEADETELAPSRKTRKRPRARNKKFVSLIERGGNVRSVDISRVRISTTYAVRKALKDNLHPKSELHTDSAAWYGMWPPLAATHETINHEQKEYARGDVTTNSAEGYFSIFKRGLVGTYQHMSKQHLQRYLNEFDFRMSNRERLGVNDAARAARAIKGAEGKRLTYRMPD